MEKKSLCVVRQDLLDAGLKVPAGDTYVDKGKFEYRWIEDDDFQILVNGIWIEAISIDFDFID